jgi:hypothetical protein
LTGAKPVLECPLEGVTSPRRVAGPQRGPAFLDHQVDDDTLLRALKIDIERLVVDHRLAWVRAVGYLERELDQAARTAAAAVAGPAAA